MRSAMRLFSLVAMVLVVSLAGAQQIRFDPDFSTSPGAVSPMVLNGISGTTVPTLATWNAHVVLRLTDGANNAETSTAYFNRPQRVDIGFTTYFAFQIHNPTTCCNPGDGLSFILQNSSATNSQMGASGTGVHALGAGGGSDALGYSGINNSLAVEFDIFNDLWDPNSNHVAIQTCGGNASLYNTPVHLSGVYTIGQDMDVTSCLLAQNAINPKIPTLGGTCNGSSCSDGAVHQVVIQYSPPPLNQQQGLLQVWLDPAFQFGTRTPVNGAPTVLSVPYNIVYNAQSNPLGLMLPKGNTVWVGFTASQPAQAGGNSGSGSPSGGTAIDILTWDFTPQAPTEITQEIPPGGTENDFTFGGHVMGVTYPSSFQNCQPTCIYMTVLATPVNQQTFYMQRLQGTQFSNENCIIYLQTGGNCVDYSVTCQDSVGNNLTCPQEPNDDIAICTDFTTEEPVSELTTDFLEAEPIGSNNWCSIWSFFNNGQGDPIVGGKGVGFSDIVATLSPTGPGPACTGSLANTTQTIQQIISAWQASSPSGFCPPID